MPGIPTLKPETNSLENLRNHWIFLLVRVQSEPLAAPLLPPLTAFATRWDTIAKQNTQLEDTILKTQAAAVAADNILNHLADQVSSAIHGGKKPNLALPLHHLYFGSNAPFEVKRPILGTQLEAMRPWPDHLAQADQPALHALAPAVTKGIADADTADKNARAALSAKDKFELDGELKQLFDAYNSLAAQTLSGLKATALAHPTLNLGTDWAESFFLHETRGAGINTIAAAEAEVKRITTALEAAKNRLAELQDKQQKAQAKKAATAEAEAVALAAKKEAAAAQQRAKDAAAAAKKMKSLRA